MATVHEAPLPADGITDALHAFRAELAATLGDVASVTWDGDLTVEGCNVEPAAESAVSVGWVHSAEDIVATLGRAPGWDLPRSPDGLKTLHAIVDAAVHGEVEVGTGRGLTVYRVRTPGGTVLEDTHEGLAGFLMSMPWKPRLRWATATAYR
ncbi:MAG: hypothetical protein IE923_02755 [Micrococcales bacterium]|nr:hypothetical protein [Micrococcales bacterium]